MKCQWLLHTLMGISKLVQHTCPPVLISQERAVQSIDILDDFDEFDSAIAANKEHVAPPLPVISVPNDEFTHFEEPAMATFSPTLLKLTKNQMRCHPQA